MKKKIENLEDCLLNVKAIENAKKIADSQDNNFTLNLNNDFLDKIGYDLKNIYDYLMISSLSSNAKKTLIDKFNKMVAMRNEYKARLNQHKSNFNLYKNTLSSLGLSVKVDKNIKKTEKLEPSISEKSIPKETISKDINNTSSEETKSNNSFPEEPERKNSDETFSDKPKSSGETKLDEFPEEPKSNNLNETTPEKPKRGKKVIAFKKAIGKLAKPARLTAVLFITGSFLLPALGSPFGLIAGALMAVALEKTIAKKKNLENHKDRKPIKDSLLNLKDKIIQKVGNPRISPEDKNELEELDAEINAYLEKEAAKDKEEELSVVSGDDTLDEEVKIAQEIMKEEGLTPEKAADKTIEMQAEKTVDDKPIFRR